MSVIGRKAIIACLVLFALFSASTVWANPVTPALRPAVPRRSFAQLFPGLPLDQLVAVFSDAGLRNTFRSTENPLLRPAPNSGIDVLSAVMERSPTQIVEALVVIPYSGRPLNMLDTYNVIGRIQNISDQLVYSPSRGGFIPLFEQSSRLEGGRRNRPIPDPPPATVLPVTETVYIILRDTFFGDTYFRGVLTAGIHGITYNMTNNAAVWFLVFPVMRAERFSAVLYIEPIAEGTLIYGMAGIDIPPFLIDRINLDFQINRRVSVLINWLREGLRSIH